ncbi:MAG: hypothetical protein ACYTEQ_19485 [Planctomycetota bacterium]|jgi:hypothetical protein
MTTQRCECGARMITLIDTMRDDYEIVCPRCDREPRKDYFVFDTKNRPCHQKTICEVDE